MANTIGWGQAAVNNTIDWGKGKTNNAIGWGSVYSSSPSGETDISGTPAGDADANAFIAAAAITDTTQKSAIEKLVVDLKGYGVWTKMKAIYPFIGGTAAQHKFNLKNPLDTNAAFRLVFNGGWTHSSTGVTPNGTNAYAETFYNPFVQETTDDNAHICIYSRTNSLLPNNVDIGAQGTSYAILSLRRSDQSGASFFGVNTNAFFVRLDNDTNTAAMYLGTRTGTTLNGWKNSTKVGTTTSSANTRPNLNYILSGYNSNGSILSGWYSNRQQALASIGLGLTDTEAANYYTAVQTFQTTLGRQVGVPIVADSDAQAFLNAAVITDQTQANAVNTLVTDLKGYGIWTKMKAIYPFVGGVASSHKYNLRNPLDTDAAFRLVFNGGWVHSNTGALPNGTNAFANTFLIENNTLSANNEHISIYSRTNSTGLFCDIGAATSITQSNIYPNYSGGFYTRVQGNSTNHVVNLNTAAMFIANRVTSTQVQGWRNATKFTLSNNSVGRTTSPFFIGNASLNGVADTNYSPRQYAFGSIGDGLTDTEAANFNTAVQVFQTTLSRNV